MILMSSTGAVPSPVRDTGLSVLQRARGLSGDSPADQCTLWPCLAWLVVGAGIGGLGAVVLRAVLHAGSKGNKR